MATTAGGTPYVESSDLVANYPAVSLALAEHIDELPSGLSIVTPTSIANSGGSASVSGGAVTFTGVTSVSLNGVFSSVYDNYLMDITFEQSTDVSINLRVRASGTDLSGSVYQWARYYVASSSATVVPTVQTNGSNFELFGAAGKKGSNSLNIASPFLSDETLFSNQYSTLTSASVNYSGIASGAVNNTTSYDGFTVFPGSGTTTGIIRCYGYQNS